MKNADKPFIGIIIVTTAPVLYKIFFGKKNTAPAEDPYKKL